MKGLELPINTMIIIAMALIILLAIITIFFSVYGPTKQSTDMTSAKYNACQSLLSTNCLENPAGVLVNGFDANKDQIINPEREASISWGSACGSAGRDNLARLCNCYYGSTTESHCKTTVCGCPETS